MIRKMELLTNFKWILKMSIPLVEMLKKEIQSLCDLSFSKIVKIEPANKVQSFFSKEDAFSARKHYFSYLSLH
jgi:DNA polymerase sigma